MSIPCEITQQGNKPLPKPMLTQLYVAIWYHQANLGCLIYFQAHHGKCKLIPQIDAKIIDRCQTGTKNSGMSMTFAIYS